MGLFNITIKAVGAHGCDRGTKPGEKLYGRCMRLNCPDCRTYDFIQLLRQMGYTVGEATLTHFPGSKVEVVDDLVKNERLSGQF